MPNAKLSLSALPADSLFRLDWEGYKLVVIRTEDRVSAYEDRCPHASWPLSQGTLRDATLECPGHGWEFDVRTGRCLNSPAYCLSPVAVTIEADTVHLQWGDSEKQNPTAQRTDSENSGECGSEKLGALDKERTACAAQRSVSATNL